MPLGRARQASLRKWFYARMKEETWYNLVCLEEEVLMDCVPLRSLPRWTRATASMRWECRTYVGALSEAFAAPRRTIVHENGMEQNLVTDSEAEEDVRVPPLTPVAAVVDGRDYDKNWDPLYDEVEERCKERGLAEDHESAVSPERHTRSPLRALGDK